MKRELKRNKLLKKALTLGLAAAVSVTSMGSTLSMLKPVIVEAEENGTEVRQVQAAEATKIADAKLAEVSDSVKTKYFSSNPKWIDDLEKVSDNNEDGFTKGVKVEKSGDNVTGIIVQAPIAEMEGDGGVVSIPIVLEFDGKADNGTFGGEVFSGTKDPDPRFENRSESIAQAWLYMNEDCDSETGVPTDNNTAKYENKHAVMWIRSDNPKYFTETGRIIKIGSNSYSVKVKDTTIPSVQIDFEKKKLTLLNDDKTYLVSVDGVVDAEEISESGTVDINNEWFGHKIFISQKGTNGINGHPLELVIPAIPAAPALSNFGVVNAASGGNKGSVKPLIDGLEYSMDEGETWTEAVKNTAYEVEKDTKISFRVKATYYSFAGEACDITIKEQKAEEIKITDADNAKISDGLTAGDADLANWKYNTNTNGLVESVSFDGNVITVNAKVGDMKKMTTAGDLNHRAFPIVVRLSSTATEAYSIDNVSSIKIERINDAWKFQNYETQEAAADAGYENGKSCVIWLSEYWTGDGHIISFDGTNMYTVKVNDISKYNITPTPEINNATVTVTDERNAMVGLTEVEIGKVYNITIEAEGGYYFSDGVVDTLKRNGYVAAPGNENLKYTQRYILSRKASDYESMSENKKISVIPAEITVTSIAKEVTPTTGDVNINYVQGGLIFSTAGKYIIDNNPAKYYAVNDKYQVTSDDVGKTIKVKKAASDKFNKDSEALLIEIKRVPKPTGLGISKVTSEESSDGKITGVTTDMLYKKNTDVAWIACTETEVTSLGVGTYYVRYKTNDVSETAGFEDSTVYATVEIVDSSAKYIHLEADRDGVSDSTTYGTAKTFSITINSVGDNSSTPASITLDDTGATRFTLSTDTMEINGTTNQISITAPNTLAVGTYNETLRVRYVDGSNAEKHVLVQIFFIVNARKWPSLTGQQPTASSVEAGKIVVDTDGITGKDSGASYEYGYTASAMTEPTQTYSTSTITGVETGEYYVFVRVAGDSNHEPSDWVVSAGKVSVTGATSSSDDSGNTGGNTSGNTGGNTSGNTGGSTGGTGGTGGTGTTPTPTPSTPTVTTTPDGTVVTTNKDGAYVDKNGNIAANTLIKESTGAMHVTDSTGHIVKNEVVTAADGKAYVVGAEGNVVVSDIAEIKGNKYVADEKGELVTNAFSSIGGEKYYSDAEGLVKTDGFFNAAGKKYYADEDGVVAVKTLITVNGKKYFATKTGAIAAKKIVTTGGKKYFATKSGAIATKKVVTTGGKKYFATKDGSLATNKWVKSGNKKYFCNKKGVITKTKKIKAK